MSWVILFVLLFMPWSNLALVRTITPAGTCRWVLLQIILLKCTPSPLQALIQCKLHLSRGSLVQGQKSLFLKVFSQDEVPRERVLVCKRSKNTTIKNNFPGPWKLWRGKVVFRLVSYSNDPTERKLVITWGAMAGLAFSVPSVWITCKKPIVLF